MTRLARTVLRSIIIGPPGSGKGTIASRITKDFPMKHISSGDLLRSSTIASTEIGKSAQRYIKKGQLVPDTEMIGVFMEELQRWNDTSVLLDGFPRTQFQAQSLQEKNPIDVVVYLNVPFSVIIERIQGRWTHAPSGRIYHTEFNPPKVKGKDDMTGEDLIQREDDKSEVVHSRLNKFQEQTEPVLEYYRKLNVLEEFKGSYSNEIWPRVHKFLSTIQKPLQYTKYG